MLTRMARRQRGSQQLGDTSTPSIPRAAAQRNTAPTLEGSARFSSTATRRAPRHTSSGVSGAGRAMAHRTPRVSAYPVRPASTSRSAVYTGTSPHRPSSSAAKAASRRRSMSRDKGVRPASRAQAMALALSTMITARSGSRRLRSWAWVSPA